MRPTSLVAYLLVASGSPCPRSTRAVFLTPRTTSFATAISDFGRRAFLIVLDNTLFVIYALSARHSRGRMSKLSPQWRQPHH